MMRSLAHYSSTQNVQFRLYKLFPTAKDNNRWRRWVNRLINVKQTELYRSRSSLRKLRMLNQLQRMQNPTVLSYAMERWLAIDSYKLIWWSSAGSSPKLIVRNDWMKSAITELGFIITNKTRVRSFHELPMPGDQEFHGSWLKITWTSGNSRIIAARSMNGHKVWLLQSKRKLQLLLWRSNRTRFSTWSSIGAIGKCLGS
jgi:hypothetical protein